MKKLLIMTFALLLVLTGCATTEPENTPCGGVQNE
jgi:predicted component of type VI protein secretion system